MSHFTDKYAHDLKLLLDPIVKQVRETLPTYADAFAKRVREDLVSPTGAAIEKLDAIRTSGRYSPDGDRTERRLVVQASAEKLKSVEAATVAKLQTQREDQRAALNKPKPSSTDPAMALVHELRAQEARTLLRGLDPLTLATRIRQVDSTDLLDVLDGAPDGFPIASPELIQEARTRIAEANHPELGQLAALESAYSFAIGVAKQVVLKASGLTEREAVTPTPAPTDTRPPYLVSTGEAVPR